MNPLTEQIVATVDNLHDVLERIANSLARLDDLNAWHKRRIDELIRRQDEMRSQMRSQMRDS